MIEVFYKPFPNTLELRQSSPGFFMFSPIAFAPSSIQLINDWHKDFVAVNQFSYLLMNVVDVLFNAVLITVQLFFDPIDIYRIFNSRISCW